MDENQALTIAITISGWIFALLSQIIIFRIQHLGTKQKELKNIYISRAIEHIEDAAKWLDEGNKLGDGYLSTYIEKDIEKRKEIKNEIEVWWKGKYKKHLTRISYHSKLTFSFLKDKKRKEQMDYFSDYYLVIKNLPMKIEEVLAEDEEKEASSKLDDVLSDLTISYMSAILSLELITKEILK